MLGPEMAEKPQTESNPPAQPHDTGRGRRRGHRGGRGRGPRRPEQITPAGTLADTAPSSEQKLKTGGSAISQAIEEVTQIVEALKQTLDQMEEVLELVELAERQKLADEREIDSLRHALSRIHQPRGERPERPQPNG